MLEAEFEPVDPGRYRVETLGAPFEIEIPEGWLVRPNSFGHFVLADLETTGRGDRDIAMIRPSNLADPDRPAAPVDQQAGDWPVSDIEGWLAALVPGVVEGTPVNTTIGGRDAVRFEVDIGEEVGCGEGFCIGFATNRLVNSMIFSRGIDYRVWWIDGGREAPIAIRVGVGSDPSFLERAEDLLDSMWFESIGPNPIPSEGDLWEVGIPVDVPAGSVSLPVGPGVSFDLPDEYFVFQNEYFAAIELDVPGVVDIFFPDRSFDGEPIGTVEEALGVLERVPEVSADVVAIREVGGHDATEVVVSSEPRGPDEPPVRLYRRADLPDFAGWAAPPDGRIWILETTTGIAVVTAEWFDPSAKDAAEMVADKVLDSIGFGP